MIINKQSGFTLIETLVYIALFLILIGGGAVGAYQIIQSTDRTSDKTGLEQDGNFIVRKIDWALTGATDVSVPTPEHLIVTRSPDTVDFTLVGTDFEKDGLALNSSRVKIASMYFEVVEAANKPKEIKANLIINTSDDKLSQAFSITRYLRQ